MCERSHIYIIAVEKKGNRASVWRADCDSWHCEECAEKKQMYWLKRAWNGTQSLIEDGHNLAFLTLTARGRQNKAEVSWQAFQKAWPIFRKRYSRAIHSKPAYLAIVEIQQRGALHLHVLMTAADMSQHALHNMAYASGFGHQAKSATIDNPLKASSYVSKYLTKSLTGQDLPVGARRIRVSSDWPDLPGDKTDYPDMFEYTAVIATEIQRRIDALEQMGYSVSMRH